MRILAIETSCDETAAAVVESGRRVLSSVVYSQIEEHRLYGGVVPEIASRRHIEQIIPVVNSALAETGCTATQLDAIAVTAAPGLVGALLVGVGFAKGLSLAAGKPLVPVHHIRGHIASNYLAHPELEPPFLCLVVSGGHTEIVEVKSYTDFAVLGRTRDDAAGESFDKVARTLGLPYPGGVSIDRLAQTGNPAAYPLPRPAVEGAPLDMSFSGLKTHVINMAHNAAQREEALDVPDLAAAFAHTVAEILCDRTLLAARQLSATKIAVAGGVAANSQLRDMLTARCEGSGYELYIPPLALCGDNAAMIGAQAYYEYLAGNLADTALNARAGMRISESF